MLFRGDFSQNVAGVNNLVVFNLQRSALRNFIIFNDKVSRVGINLLGQNTNDTAFRNDHAILLFNPVKNDLTGVSGNHVIGIVFRNRLAGGNPLAIFDPHFRTNGNVDSVLATGLRFRNKESTNDNRANIAAKLTFVKGFCS